MSRRTLFGLAGAGAALAGAGAAVGAAVGSSANSGPAEEAAAIASPVEFHGEHQAGIVTAAQDRMHFVALDVTTGERAALVDLLKKWTRAAERMTAGAEVSPLGAVGGNPDAPPDDNGEALGLAASQLTLTLGLGPSLFDGRFGLADRKPAALAELPHFQGDKLDPARSGGDLCIQACANDPQVAVHAIRHLVRIGFGTTAVRWSQLGFGRTSSTSTAQATPRNLFGFKDGTNNVKAEDPDALRDHVWVAPGDGPAWMAGGSYLVARRIRMHIEIWDRTSLSEQQRLVGRSKGTGAPLGKSNEFDLADYQVSGNDGRPLIDENSHIRLASAAEHGGARMLRRGYNFVDGADGSGHLDAGLFFIAFVRDPGKQFVPIQRALASKDEMTQEYLEHTGSALFAVPPGVKRGGFWADGLFG
ncbi:iron uptake transporter deferrochelatase/peroxidase subunit [Pseudonocardia acaciae]|uniref:iron uptake transporter deferrochelatase/peroxidase subunit n=1 Tax=Pseudonocardia acaciae TaxID=551276 RepID=UPI00048BD75D